MYVLSSGNWGSEGFPDVSNDLSNDGTGAAHKNEG